MNAKELAAAVSLGRPDRSGRAPGTGRDGTHPDVPSTVVASTTARLDSDEWVTRLATERTLRAIRDLVEPWPCECYELPNQYGEPERYDCQRCAVLNILSTSATEGAPF